MHKDPSVLLNWKHKNSLIKDCSTQNITLLSIKMRKYFTQTPLLKYKNSSAIWQHLQISLPGTWVCAPHSLLKVRKINTCHDSLTYHRDCEHNEIRPKFRWARSVLGASYGFLRHRSCRQKQGTNGKQKHTLSFSPTLGCTHVLNTTDRGNPMKSTAISDMQIHII